MTIREQLELSERTYLSSYAMLSQDSRGGTEKNRNAIFVRFFSVTGIGSCTANLSGG